MLHRHAGPVVAGSYLAGAIGGALTSIGVVFVLSGLLSPVPDSARQVVAIVMVLVLLIHALGVICLDLPQRKYQIPRETFTDAPARAAFRFAFELGTGVRTYITSVSPYALAILILLGLPAGLGAGAGAAGSAAVGYGVGRSIVVASQSMRRKVAVPMATSRRHGGPADRPRCPHPFVADREHLWSLFGS